MLFPDHLKAQIDGKNFTEFTDEFLDLLLTLIVEHKKLILVGNFNIHLGNKDDPDALQFNDSMEGLGFTQHVTESTHNKNNILDHIYTEIALSIKVKNVNLGEYLSDHKWVNFNIYIQKSKLMRETRKVRRLDKIDLEEFFNNVNFNEIADLDTNLDLVELLNQYNNRITTVVNKHAPERIVKSKKGNYGTIMV